MQQQSENLYAEKCRAALFNKIARFGAITTEDFMAHCLTDQLFGYYRHANLGEDFITAPMFSEEFGAAVGEWVELSWKRLRKPQKLMLVEAGPGRGELLHDVLAYLQENCPELIPRLDLHLLEVNPSLRQKQAQVLKKFSEKFLLRDVVWHESIESLPQGACIFIANEFFDALPTRQYLLQLQYPLQYPSQSTQSAAQSSAQQWRCFMRRIAISDESAETAGLRFVRAELCLLPPILLNAIPQVKQDFAEKVQEKVQEKVVEISPQTLAIVASLAQMLVRFGGAVFICDYGYFSQEQAKRGGSLQAFLKHKVVDPLRYCGACDLSAEVDFASLANEFSVVEECDTKTQSEFLLAAEVFKRRGKDSSSVAKNERLLAKNAMGERFKVLTAFSKIPD